MKSENIHKIIIWSLVVVGAFFIFIPSLFCLFAMDAAQCFILSIMFSMLKIIFGIFLIVGAIILFKIKPESRKRTYGIFAMVFLFLIILFLAVPRVDYFFQTISCSGDEGVETVMSEGMTISAEINGEVVNIFAGPCYERTYSLGDKSCTIMHGARGERWYGSFGIYSPSKMDWKYNCPWLVHSVVEEGQRHFTSQEEMQDWVDEELGFRPDDVVYTNDGLMVLWDLYDQGEGPILDVRIWQFYINGEKPTMLIGARDDKINVIFPNNKTTSGKNEKN